jgi:sterol desaturase/sphingolipid hydroxylase (fatty acid hydroxylase superfamily)
MSVETFGIARSVIGVGGFVGLWIVEWARPFRPLGAGWWRRYATNLFITGSNAALLSGLLGGALVAAYQAFELGRVGLLHGLGVRPWLNACLTIILLDGVTYAWHRAYHGRPLLWRLHRVHHSDLALDVTSSGRFHLMEMALSAAFRLGVIALLGLSLAGIVAFEIVFGLLNQLEHANVSLGRWDAPLRRVFVTPDMHRVHHSQVKAHTNSNYSTIFSFWDRLFGTYREARDQRALVIGLPEYPQPEDVTAGKVWAMPFGPPCRREAVGRESGIVHRGLPTPAVSS